jgi:hypothetical protein
MDPQVKRKRTIDVLKRIVLRESLKQPIIIIFEDLHWIDSETQSLLDLLVDGIANARVLLLVNYRPEYSHAWTNKSYYMQLRLDALGRESAEEMLVTLVGDGVELNPLKRLIIERTEGNPFFIEEMVQGLFDDGALIRDSPHPGPLCSEASKRSSRCKSCQWRYPDATVVISDGEKGDRLDRKLGSKSLCGQRELVRSVREASNSTGRTKRVNREAPK